MRKTAANKAFHRALCLSLPPIPALTVTEWADAYRILSEASEESGPYSSDRIPMQKAPMNDVTNAEVAEIVLQWAAQTAGKSELLNNVCGYFMHADPAPQLFVQPTIELGEAYSKERIAPMIRDSPVLKGLVRDPRSRDSGNTVKSKVYPGGNLAMVGANAPSGLAGRPRKVILLDEIDRFPVSAGTEGDPCALADRRAEAFASAVKIKTSTPTVKGLSRIENLLQQSDYQKWHCRCPRCQHEQVWAWEQVKWPKDKPEEAWLECANCKAKLDDKERVASVRAGCWKPTQPFKGIRGYWINGINTLFRHHKGFRNRLHEMAAEFLKAKAGGPATMRVWINTFLAETFEEEAEAPTKPEELLARCEEYTPEKLPEEVLLLTASVDVQKDRLESTVFGWGADEEVWCVEKREFDGDPEQDEVWKKLDDYLLQSDASDRRFMREDGVPLNIDRTFVDMGHKSTRVLLFCAPRISRGVYPCRGLGRTGIQIPPILPQQPSRNNRAKLPHWNVGTTMAKQALFDRLGLQLAAEGPTPRAIHFPKQYGFGLEHFKQLTSEKRKLQYSYGQAYSVFVKANSSARNEALDLFVYGLAALYSFGRINWQKIAEQRLKQRPRDPEPPPTEQQQAEAKFSAPVRMPRQSWATRW